MRQIRSLLSLAALCVAAFGASCLAEDAAAPALDSAASDYRQRERDAREKYLSDIEAARTQYGEGTPEYQTAALRAADEYRDKVSAAAASQPDAAVTEQTPSIPAGPGTEPVVVQEQSDWDYVKGKTKEGGRAVGRAAEKTGDAIGEGAKRVGRFFKDGYEDVKSSITE